MASLKLSISFEPERSNFYAYPLQFPAHCSVFSIITFNRAPSISCSGRFYISRVSPIGTELQEVASESVRGDSSNQKRKGTKGSRIWTKSKVEKDDLFVYEGGLDANYGVIQSADLSLEHCNFVLKRLEKESSDSKTLRFFEWMRKHGKLVSNVTAYNVILRVFGRRRDWESAATTIEEVTKDCGNQVDFRLFNTLIFACCKQGNVRLSSKWFRMMLELGVEPNIATFGMLMGLYQKGRNQNVREAEFAFGQMRSFGITCESAYSSMITIYTRLSMHAKAEEVICFMKEDNVVFNVENWLVVINAYSQSGKLVEAEKMFVSMQEAGFPPNIVAYNTLITGYGKVSNMIAAQRLFLAINDAGLHPDETTYRSMIEGWGRMGNYKEAGWYYKELKRSGFKPNSSNLYTLINLQAAHGDEVGAIQTLNDFLEMKCQHSSIVGTVMKAYERAGRIDKVPLLLVNRTSCSEQSLIDLQPSFYQHILVNQTSCSIVVMAYVKNSLVDDAIKVLREKRWKDPRFEDNLYHLLICSCKELGKLENAVKIYTQMPKSDDEPNLHISCTMIGIYTMMGRFGEGEELYLKVKSSGIPFDLIGFSIVVRMYIKAGSLKDACAVLETMENQKNIVPDVYLYRDMLRVYQQCDMVSKLKDLYYNLLKSGIVWDQEMYRCVINCCANALPVDEISRLYSEMIRKGFVPNTVTLNVMLNVYGRSGLFEEAEEMLQMAKKRGLVDAISYNTMVAAYRRNNDFKMMSSTVRTMQLDGFSVSLEAFNCMLDGYGKEGQMGSFQNVLKRMKESNSPSDNYTYNIMMNIYGEQGWIEEVEQVLKELKECGLRPDVCSYNTLIKAYGIAGMVKEAVSLMKEMRENGVEPNKITYTNLIIALQKNDQYLESVKWSLWMKQIGI
ncbi:Pentatricopeptide repeat-containing protein At4g30825, chloroplastic [Linum grandiflorum]